MFFQTLKTLPVCLMITALHAQTGQPPVTKGLTVTVLQGDGVQNDLPRPVATHLSIRVVDSQGTPLPNAVAAFELPEVGASATFPDDAIVKVLLTDANGEATTEIRPNNLPGKFQPRVKVNYLGQTSSISLSQENLYPVIAGAHGQSLRPHHRGISKKTILLIVGTVAVGVLVGVLVHGHHSAATTTTQPPQQQPGGITINPGTGSVTGGH